MMNHETQYRRPRSLQLYWENGEMRAENYRRRVTVGISGEVASLLDHLGDWTTAEAAASQIPGGDPTTVGDCLEVLAAESLLLRQGDGDDLPRAGCWEALGEAACRFHFTTRDQKHVVRTEDLPYREELQSEPSPPPFKRYRNAPRLYLPRAFVTMGVSYQEALLRRRTCREFEDLPIGLREFSTLLFTTFAPMYFADAGELGVVQFRTSASGGSRHESECYVGVLRVEDVEPGLYHYSALDHSLERISSDFTPETAMRTCCDQPWIAAAGCVLYITTVFERMAWKYRNPRTYRVILMNLGHLGQTFSMNATALCLGPFVTAAIAESEIERLLGLDEETESAMAAFGCGIPSARAREGRPDGSARATLLPLVLEVDLPASAG